MDTFTVSASRLVWLQDKLTKLNKKAAKLGTTPITLNVLSTEQRKVVVDHNADQPITAVQTWHEVAVEGNAPVIAGWQFVATLEHLGAGTLLKRVPTVEDVDLSAYKNSTPDNCDHCHIHRFRNDTYVVRNVETGETQQVGSSCLKDFLGHMNPEAYARWAESMSDFVAEASDEDPDDFDFTGGASHSDRFGISIHDYLADVSAIMEQEGWIAGSVAWERQIPSTAERAWDNHFATQYKVYPSDRDKETATQVLDWARALNAKATERSDYLYNLMVAANEEVVYWTTKGLIGSAVQAWRKDQERVIKAAAQRENKTDDFVGTVGERRDFNVTVTFYRSFEGDYSTTHMYKMEDETGNQIVWYASNPILTQGKSYRLKATVKKHETHPTYGKSTVITRAKIEEEL